MPGIHVYFNSTASNANGKNLSEGQMINTGSQVKVCQVDAKGHFVVFEFCWELKDLFWSNVVLLILS